MNLLWPYIVLILLGCGWGLTIPLTVISVSTDLGHLGLIFWQFFIITVLFGFRQIYFKKPLSLTKNSLKIFCVIAFIGTLFPNSASLFAASYLPGGVLSILIATVPMFAFPIALFLGIDRFRFSRLLGIVFGFLGVYLLIAPKTALPDPSVAWVIPIALIAPLFYGLEGNFVSKIGTGQNSPIEVLLGASIIGCFITFPLALLLNQFVDPFVTWDIAHYALVLSSVIHGLVYATYVWLVTKTGSVFSAQVSYFVTFAGVIWSMVILNEVHSYFIWISLICMVLGMALVKPRTETEKF